MVWDFNQWLANLRMRCSSYFKPLPQTDRLPQLNRPCEWSTVFFICEGAIIDQGSLLVDHISINTFLKTSTTLKAFRSNDCWDHQFGLLRFIGGWFLLYDQDLHHSKNIRPSRYERVLVVYARDNGRPLSAERELTVYFPQAERGAGQRGTCNNTTYSGSQAIRRQPQMHDERFGWQSKKNIPYVSVQLENHFFLSSQPSTIQAVTWCDIVLTIFTGFSVSYSSQAIEEYWIRNEFPSQAFF